MRVTLLVVAVALHAGTYLDVGSYLGFRQSRIEIRERHQEAYYLIDPEDYGYTLYYLCLWRPLS